MPDTNTNTGLTGTAQFSQVKAREVDFVTRFNQNWEKLRAILGITRPIRKTPGTELVAYEAKMVDTMLQGGASVGEGQDIPFTQFTVEPKMQVPITIEKFAKQVSIEAVANYGAQIAVEKTDDQFLVELQNRVMKNFFQFLTLAGTLKGTQKTWQRALAIAKGAVLNRFSKMNKTVTEVVGFVNIMDFYDYLGDAPVTVQTQFGLNYVKNFMGYSTLFLMDEDAIPSKKVVAVPVDNMFLYYIDPADSDFVKLGLEYTSQGETNLIGFHAEGNYHNATGESYALMGMQIFAEYLDGICIVTVGSSNSDPVVVPLEGSGS